MRVFESDQVLLEDGDFLAIKDTQGKILYTTSGRATGGDYYITDEAGLIAAMADHYGGASNGLD